MNDKKTKNDVRLPLSILYEAMMLSCGGSDNFCKTVYGVINTSAEKKRNNPTHFPVFGVYYDEKGGVIVPLLTESQATETQKIVGDFATELSVDIASKMPVEENIDELLSGYICALGENISAGKVYHWDNADNTITGVGCSYLNRAVAVVTIEGCSGVVAQKLADIIALNALYYFPSFKDYYILSKMYDGDDFSNKFKKDFITHLSYSKLLFPYELRDQIYNITYNCSRKYWVIDDLLGKYAKEHFLKTNPKIIDFKIFGI